MQRVSKNFLLVSKQIKKSKLSCIIAAHQIIHQLKSLWDQSLLEVSAEYLYSGFQRMTTVLQVVSRPMAFRLNWENKRFLKQLL